MNLLIPYIILIERRLRARLIVVVVTCLALLSATLGLPAAHANSRGAERHAKVARDLDDEVAAPAASKPKWARDVNGVRHIQAIIVSNDSDPEMTNLRAQVQRLGGAVHAVHPAVHAITVQVKASDVRALSQRSDVASVSPNRITQRTVSMIESITGAASSNVRTYSSAGVYSGLDGSGVGIAILDSGVMADHLALKNGSTYRVRNSVNMLNANLANWATGTGSATSLAPGSTELSTYEAAINSQLADTQDPYGHGTHVASVAAGRYYAPSANTNQREISGVAPNADIHDVRVLNNLGFGTLSDALEGIQWVIYHAKEYNIRVLNVSLAASSTESWQTDPLCVAVRSASAAGITVVVAAGNFGLSFPNKETYGRISSPGNDPSVITVGSANTKGTITRGDDSVNNFSSRGPTRSAYVDAGGVRRVDNLLKPDLVAPGNLVVGAGATPWSKLTWNFLGTSYASALVTPLAITATWSQTQMLLSGTSIAAPAVAGAAALMLQANPGLTPPLIKAIL